MRNLKNFKNWTFAMLLLCSFGISCTKLDVKTYSVVPASSYFQNAAQVAAAKAPAYAAVSNLYGNTWLATEVSSDEMIFPTRGSDWYDGGTWASLYYHVQTSADQFGWIGGMYNDNLNGASQCNFIIYSESHLASPPTTLTQDIAELTCLRSLFYFYAMDIFGNIPYVTDVKVDPSTVQTIPRAQVFDSIERDLLGAIPDLTSTVDATTYGKATKWLAYSILARMYLNAGVYKSTGSYTYGTNGYWQKCIDVCDTIIQNGPYSLDPEYFNSFYGQNNLATPENIFVIPASGAGTIVGNGIIQRTIEFNSSLTFGIPCCNYGNNGASATHDFYQWSDTNSTYTYADKSLAGRTVFSKLRTFNDHRTAQWLIGQQFQGDGSANYPPWNAWPVDNADPCCTYNGDASTKTTSKIGDFYNSLYTPVIYYDKMMEFSNPTDTFRHAGVRNIKYWPQAGNATGNQGNAMLIFRLADIYLMRAESEYNLGLTAAALADFNAVRERAYGGSTAGDWVAGDITPANILHERGRELAWELVRRTDQVRFGTFTAAHIYPPKPADADDHFNLYPIPQFQITSNPNLQQNPGY